MRIESVSDIVENSNNHMNKVVLGTANRMEGAEIIYKIDEALKARGITQQDLAKMTGINHTNISRWVNGKTGININKVHLLAIMVALRITDVSELISVKLPSELENKYEQQRVEWISSKKLPDEVKDMFRENLLASMNLTDDKI